MFITFEGIDSSGKTTQLLLLERWFQRKNIPCMVIREPGGTIISERIRELLLDPIHAEMSEVAELFLFSAARAQLTTEVIIPALKKHITVLCDRYYDSTTAYQGYGRGIDLESIKHINQLATQQMRPAITFYFDIPYDESLHRKGLTNSDADRMERSSIKFYEQVRTGYLTIADEEKDRVHLLDGMQDIDTLHQIITDVIHQKMFRYV